MPGEENAALDLAAVEGIDALFLGHQHLLLPGADFAGIAGVDIVAGAVGGRPAVMAGFWGSHLGIIDLALERRSAAWRVAETKVEARPIYRRDDNGVVTATTESDLGVLAASQAAHEATLVYVRAPVGRLASPLHSFFALIADDPTIQLVNAAQLDFGKTLIAGRADLAGLPILAAASPFKCGGRGGPDYYTDIAPGPIAIKDIADIYPYPNTLRVVRIDGATLGEWLERSAAIFRRIDPSATGPQALFDPGFTSYNFDVIDGVSYAIDVTQPARYDDTGKLIAASARRIRDLRFTGLPIDPKQMFLVVTNNYRASGGGGFPGCGNANVVIEAQDDNRSVLMRYVAGQGLIEPKTDGNWRLAPWPATTVVTYDTAPAAAGVAPPERVKVTSMGAVAGGFFRFRVEAV
jgi:2',3'-cyclic-nucleotide 2'-phosphodiesterase/3'-nucleotidase